MKDAFDDMQSHYDGKNAKFDPSFYHELVQCFNKYDDKLLRKSQIAAWKGFKDYWLTHETNKDYLGNPDYLAGDNIICSTNKCFKPMLQSIKPFTTIVES